MKELWEKIAIEFKEIFQYEKHGGELSELSIAEMWDDQSGRIISFDLSMRIGYGQAFKFIEFINTLDLLKAGIILDVLSNPLSFTHDKCASLTLCGYIAFSHIDKEVG